MAEPIIVTENLGFTYPPNGEKLAFPVFENLSVTVDRGSFTAVIGPNGCGKSTLAKHFNGILLPSGGRVLVSGMDTSDENLLLEIRRTVGMVFQNPDNQIVSNVVEEDVAFAPENLGVPTAEIHYRDAQNATVLMVSHSMEEVIETVSRLNRERGITVVLITHHMSEAVNADRVIVMHEGGILLDGSPREVFTQVQTLREAGLDVPQTTELLYELKNLGWDVPLDALSEAECAAAILKVLRRPE